MSAAAESATSIPGATGTPGYTEAYLARLRAVLPQSWLQREYQRRRSFPAFAHSRQLVAKGQYEEAFQELETYLASDPDDLVIQFGYLVLASELKRYRAAIGAADRILATVPDFAPALFYRGLARAALGENKEALPDLFAAAASNALAPADSQYARRSLATAAVESPATGDALALLGREESPLGADGTLLVAKGQLLERLGHKAEAKAAYDNAVEQANNNEDCAKANHPFDLSRPIDLVPREVVDDREHDFERTRAEHRRSLPASYPRGQRAGVHRVHADGRADP